MESNVEENHAVETKHMLKCYAIYKSQEVVVLQIMLMITEDVHCKSREYFYDMMLK